MKFTFEAIQKLIAPHILDRIDGRPLAQVPLIKKAITLQLFADKLHVLVVGSPGSCAKSSFRISLQQLVRNFSYASAPSSTRIGLQEAACNDEGTFMMLDEVDKPSSEIVQPLLEILQNQTVTVRKHREHYTLPARVNVFAMANPYGNRSEWIQYGNVDSMKGQLSKYSQALLRRFHIPIFAGSYTPTEFTAVNKHKVALKERFPEGFRFNPSLVDEFNDYLSEARGIIVQIEGVDRVFSFLEKLKMFEKHILTPVTNELLDGCIGMAEALARIRHSNVVEKKDWDEVMRFFIECLQTGGLSSGLVENYADTRDRSRIDYEME